MLAWSNLYFPLLIYLHVLYPFHSDISYLNLFHGCIAPFPVVSQLCGPGADLNLFITLQAN